MSSVRVGPEGRPGTFSTLWKLYTMSATRSRFALLWAHAVFAAASAAADVIRKSLRFMATHYNPRAIEATGRLGAPPAGPWLKQQEVAFITARDRLLECPSGRQSARSARVAAAAGWCPRSW